MIRIIEEHDHCEIDIERLRKHIETLSIESDKTEKKGSLISDIKKKDEKIAQLEKGLQIQVIENVFIIYILKIVNF